MSGKTEVKPIKTNLLDEMKARQAKIEALLAEQRAVVEANKDEVERAKARLATLVEQLAILKKEQLASIEEAVAKIKDKYSPRMTALETEIDTLQGINVVAARAGKASGEKGTRSPRGSHAVFAYAKGKDGNILATMDGKEVYVGKDTEGFRKALVSRKINKDIVSAQVSNFERAL